MTKRSADRRRVVVLGAGGFAREVRWLIEEHGLLRFRELWRRLADGEDFRVAFLRVYETRVREQEALWQRHFMRRYAWIPLISSATTPWFIVILLVLAGWFRKRRRSLAKLALWEEEDRLRDALEAEEP